MGGERAETAAPARSPLRPVEPIQKSEQTRRLHLIGSFPTHEQSLERALELLRQGVSVHEIRVMASAPRLLQPRLARASVVLRPAEGALIGAVAAGFVGALLSVLDPAISAFDAVALATLSVLFGGIGGAVLVLPLRRLRGRAAPPPPASVFSADQFHLLLDQDHDQPGETTETSRTGLIV